VRPIGVTGTRRRSPELEVNVDDDVSGAFKPIYIDAFRMAKAIASKMCDDATADDVAEGVCLKLWEDWKADPHGFVLPSDLKGYLATAVRNRVINFAKWHRRREQRQYAFQEMRESDHADTVPGGSSEPSKLERAFGRALMALSERQRECLLRSREDGMTYAMLADELDLSINTVQTHMQVGRQRLRTLVPKYLEEEDE
jgi:RNA polymerase sigma-19 factor, ECF subfamily